MKISLLEIAGIVSSLQAMRLPKGGQPHSFMAMGEDTNNATMFIDEGDVKLATKLVKAGDEHAKAMRGIIVWLEITAPIYWWREMETYRAGRERLSCESTMHMDCNGLTGDALVKAKAEMPMGKEQKAIDYYSYQTLRRIYAQRKNHRLPQWQQFCKWIETLPMAAELITVDL